MQLARGQLVGLLSNFSYTFFLQVGADIAQLMMPNRQPSS
jgi:hypothetical protein